MGPRRPPPMNARTAARRHARGGATVRAAAVRTALVASGRFLRAAAAFSLAAGLMAGGAAPTAAAGPPGRPYAAPPLAPAVLLAHGPRTRQVVALTFDDGYDPEACGALVDLLEATATPATFFPNAVYVTRSPDLWRRVAAFGFPIGNHTASHPLMPRLTYSAQLNQIASDRSIVEAVTGRPSIWVFRPPYGAWNKSTLLAASAAGYPIVLNWDVSFADSSRRRGGRPWPIAAYIRAASRGIAGAVVLGHCGSRIDLAALPAVIAGYRARGFTFVTVPQLLGLLDAAPMSFPATPPSGPRLCCAPESPLASPRLWPGPFPF